MKIYTLPTKRPFQGSTLTQIWREGNLAIYEKEWKGMASKSYEVIKIEIRKLTNMQNSLKEQGYDTYEAYPSSEQFGRLGWDLPTIELAFEKVKQLQDKE